MSYMLEFPPRPLPPEVNSPPYVLFGIKGEECFSDLPDKIPLKLVLHFAPKLKDWLLPAPTELPKASVNIGLLTPYIGIDIQHPSVSLDGFSWILKRMLQLSGRAVPKEMFNTMTFSLVICLAIQRTWVALELPLAGLDGLHTHIIMRLMNGPAVTPTDMRVIWDIFDKSHDIVREMACNYMRAHSQMLYSREEYAEIKEWTKKTKERRRLFSEWERMVPEFGTRMDAERKLAAYEKGRTLKKKGEDEETPERDSLVVAPMVPEILEQTGTRRVSLHERRARERNDAKTLEKRLSRFKSNESLRSVDTVIWDPPAPMSEGLIADAFAEALPKVNKSEGVVSASLLEERLASMLKLQDKER